MLSNSDFNINDQFCHLPETDEGYKATITKFGYVTGAGETQLLYTKDFVIPPEGLQWIFFESDTADHSVRCVPNIEVIEIFLRGQIKGIFDVPVAFDSVDFQIDVMFSGKIILERS